MAINPHSQRAIRGYTDINGVLAYRDSKLAKYRQERDLPTYWKLTDQEFSILLLASYGYTSNEVGIILKISFETVKSHRRHLMRKLEARNMTHAVGVAIRQNII